MHDGNSFLNEVLGKGEGEAETKLTELEESPDLWKDEIVWKELYQLINENLQKILTRCLIYEIPVPMEALEVVCKDLPDYQNQLKRGLDLGLIEISSEVQEEKWEEADEETAWIFYQVIMVLYVEDSSSLLL